MSLIPFPLFSHYCSSQPALGESSPQPQRLCSLLGSEFLLRALRKGRCSDCRTSFQLLLEIFSSLGMFNTELPCLPSPTSLYCVVSPSW